MAAWSSSYEAEPQQSDSPSEGDDAIRSLKEEVRNRMANEHTAYTTTGSSGERSKDFIHRPGSARAYYQSAEPTTLPNGNALTSETDITKGTLWVDSNNNNNIYVWTGSDFEVCNRRDATRITVNGILSTGTNVTPRVVFPDGLSIISVGAIVNTSPTGSGLRVDLEKNGNTSVFSTTEYIEIAASGTSATITAAGLSTTHSVLAAGDYLELDINQVGSTVPGSDLAITIIGTV